MTDPAEPSRNDTPDCGTPAPGAAPGRILTPAAQRALEEAEARRIAAADLGASGEHGGPSGPEPTRYGDWERKGLAVGF